MAILVVMIVVFVVFLSLGLVSLKLTKSISGLITGSETVTVTDSIGVQANPSVPKAQPATLTTRTNNTSGTLTMTNTSHGIVTGQRVDLYWSGGQCYGAVVGTVAGTSVPIASVSGGSNLPIATTVIQVGISTSSPFSLTGSNIVGLAMSTPKNGYFVFNNGSADVYGAFVTGGYIHDWITGNVAANPLAGTTPTLVYMSHNDTTAANSNMQAGAVTH